MGRAGGPEEIVPTAGFQALSQDREGEPERRGQTVWQDLRRGTSQEV